MIKRLEEATKAGAALVAVIYLFGFLVNALYLGRYGVSGIGLLRVRYVLAGVWVMLPFFVLAFVAAVLAYVTSDVVHQNEVPPERRTYRWYAKSAWGILAGVAGVGFFLYFVVGWLWQQVPIAAVHERALGGTVKPLIAHSVFITFLGLMVYVMIARRTEATKWRDGGAALGFGAFLSLALLAYLVYFANGVYPHLPAVLGGGAPVPVRFVLKGPSTLQPNKPYDLLLVTDSTVVVRDGDHAVEVSRGAIDTIIYPAPPKD